MKMLCVDVDRGGDRWCPFEFTLYRVYHVWQNAMHQPCITDDFGSGWRLLRCPDGSYKLDTIERVVFIEIPE
jgi:hypothetical protein